MPFDQLNDFSDLAYLEIFFQAFLKIGWHHDLVLTLLPALTISCAAFSMIISFEYMIISPMSLKHIHSGAGRSGNLQQCVQSPGSWYWKDSCFEESLIWYFRIWERKIYGKRNYDTAEAGPSKCYQAWRPCHFKNAVQPLLGLWLYAVWLVKSYLSSWGKAYRTTGPYSIVFHR